MTMTLIETKTLASAAASIEFTEIPQDGTDLVLLVSMRGSLSNFYSEYRIRFNGSTTGFSARSLYGNGSTAATGTFEASAFGVGATATANTFSNDQIYIPNYTSSNAKSFSSDFAGENNATSAFAGLYANLWTGTAAITSIQITEVNAANFVSGSTFSLYKITKGSDGIVTTS